jgi:Domain of Unknown Function (DUF1521)
MTVITPRPMPLTPANGYGVGGSASTKKDASGNAVFDSPNYEITVTSNSVVTIHNKVTGETYQVSGDPHVAIDGVQAFDFHESMTFVLNDGTKVTIDTAPWGSSGATVASRVTITNADAQYGVQINGASLSDGRDISFEETTSLGDAMDAATADNNAIFENWDGSGFVRFDVASNRTVVVDQAGVNAMELAEAGGMFDPEANPNNTLTTRRPSANNAANNPANNPRSTPMTFTQSIFASDAARFATNFLSNANAGTANNVDIAAIAADQGYTYRSDGWYSKTVDGTTVSMKQPLGAGTNVELKYKTKDGITFSFELNNDNGDYTMGTHTVSGTGSAAMDRFVNQAAQSSGANGLLSFVEMANDVVRKGKKKGEADAAGGDAGHASQSWFVALAEGLGEVLNKLAIELKTAIDNVDLNEDTGQPPYKEGMRIQGLAQQLQFISQAFMTALNSIGESIKTTVTAGGAAR